MINNLIPWVFQKELTKINEEMDNKINLELSRKNINQTINYKTLNASL